MQNLPYRLPEGLLPVKHSEQEILETRRRPKCVRLRLWTMSASLLLSSPQRTQADVSARLFRANLRHGAMQRKFAKI